MDDIEDSSSGLTPRKRTLHAASDSMDKPLNLTGSQFITPMLTDTEDSNKDLPSVTNCPLTRAESPALSASTLTSIDTAALSSNAPADQCDSGILSNNADTAAIRPAKRRKLSPSEKLLKEQEKDQKEKEKIERKAIREEEKRIKDKEKQQKAEDRENKRRVKELEEERKAQEKRKKERAQTKLGAFFQPKLSESKLSSDNQEPGPPASNAELLDARSDIAPKLLPSNSGTTRTYPHGPIELPGDATEYKSFFLPFVPPSHSTVWSPNNNKTSVVNSAAHGTFINELRDRNSDQRNELPPKDAALSLRIYFKHDRQINRGSETCSVRTIVDHIHGKTQDKPIDLTHETAPLASLQMANWRIIQFEEDVRPPYSGTYTKIQSALEKRRFARNPFHRMRSDTDYGYDSEVEWEEPEEGEDILAEDEDDAESMGDGDDMDEFLDDDEDLQKNKRRIIVGDLQPANTGLCWETGSTQGQRSNATAADKGIASILDDMEITFLLPGFQRRSIDPFSNAYWQSDMAPPTMSVADSAPCGSRCARPPLTERNSNTSLTQHFPIGIVDTEKGTCFDVVAILQTKKGRKPLPKKLDANEMESFKDAVNGSPLPKLDLLKGLKQRFPKITNDAIKDTLATHFAQQGTGKSKKWIFTGCVEDQVAMSGAMPLGA